MYGRLPACRAEKPFCRLAAYYLHQTDRTLNLIYQSDLKNRQTSVTPLKLRANPAFQRPKVFGTSIEIGMARPGSNSFKMGYPHEALMAAQFFSVTRNMDRQRKKCVNAPGMDELAGPPTEHNRSLLPRTPPEAIAELTPAFAFGGDELRSCRKCPARLLNGCNKKSSAH